LLIDVITIWLNDKMLVTLTALKIWRMAFGVAKNKTLEQESFSFLQE